MHIDLTGGLRRGLMVAATAASISLGIAACTDSASIDPQRDRVAPTLTLTPGTGQADTVIAFSTEAKDNLGLKTVHVRAVGAVSPFAYDTTFTSAVTTIRLPFTLFSSRSVPPGTPVIVTAEALDGAGNSSGVDTLILATGNVPPPEIRIISPTSGSSAVLGKSIVVTVMGKAAIKVRSLGLSTTGPVVVADSIIYSSPLRDSLTMQDTIAIPANATPGTLTITPFLRDSLGQRAVGPAITITVQTAAQVNSVPVVNNFCQSNQSFDNACGHGKRLEVTDTVHVEADDPSGIAQLGYEVRSVSGGPIDDSATFLSNGQLTFQPHTFSMRLPYTAFPTTAYIQVFARNANGVKAYAKLSSGLDRIDTVTIVAGVTRNLPFGGQVADAYYHPTQDRLYLTNILLNRVEVFSLTDSSFKAPINVGSRPWGIAPWPRDRNGTPGDTLLVANSGGTDISYVDLRAGTSGSGAEVFRYALPNIILASVTSVQPATGGPNSPPIQERTKYDFSDRPQFLASTCIASGAACTDVVLVYSTTPTQGQLSPFADNNGTIRWENLTRGTSHFFFEQAIGPAAGRGDTLEIERFDANSRTSTTLLEYKQILFITPGAPAIDSTKPATPPDTTFYSVVVNVGELAFRDTTFVRNSGNFRRAVIGEGGSILGSRAMTFDATAGFETVSGVTTGVDLGVSPPEDVTDWTANSFAQVKGAAINFDGTLSAIRGDSTYLINQNLRLQGVFGTAATNAGLDFHPLNTGQNSFPLNTRLVFAAAATPTIEVYDTHCYQRVGTIPIRDPIIGPLTAAYRVSTGQLVLVGATARGIVIATLPNAFTTTCP
jgi:hypothetical protein